MASIAMGQMVSASAAAAAAGTGVAMSAGAAMVGGAIAAFIDSQLLMPALFPADPEEGMKVGEMGIMTADKGSPTAAIYGSYAKVAGQLLWAKRMAEHTQTSGGGKSTKKITHTYSVDCAVGICRTKSSPLTSIDAVLADEIPLYISDDRQVLSELTGSGLGCYAEPTAWGGEGCGTEVTEWDYWIFFDTSINPNCITDIYNQLVVGDNINIAGFSNSYNNDSADKITSKSSIHFEDSWRNAAGWEYIYEYSYPAIRVEKAKNGEWNIVTETNTYTKWDGQTTSQSGYIKHGTSDVINITKVGDVGWASGVQRSSTPQIYLGNNPTYNNVIAAAEGAGNTPAFKDMAYIVFNDLNLEDYGTRIPNFEFICSNSALADVRACINDILSDSELLASEYDVSAVAAEEVVGYSVVGITETSKKLQPLALAFNILVQERGGVIHFLTHSATRTKVELDADYIGAYNNDKPTGGVMITQEALDNKKGEVTVAYIDVENENKFTQGLERATAFSQSDVASRETPSRWTKSAINLGLSLTPNTAREIAHRLLWMGWADDLTFSFTLPARYLYLQENDRLQIPANGKTYDALITKVDVGANYMLKVQAQLDTAISQDFSEWDK